MTGQTTKPKRKPSIDGDLLLAGLDRARKFKDDVDAEDVADQISGFFHHGATRRGENDVSSAQAAAGLRGLVLTGLVERRPKYQWATGGYYSLTSRGKRRLAYLRRRGRLPQLPPTPQWSSWRKQRQAARLELPRVRQSLQEVLDQLERVVDTNDPERLRLPQLQRHVSSMGHVIDGLVSDLIGLLERQRAPQPAKY